MRITKKMLREVKRSLLNRVRMIGQMDDESIDKEFKRCFPDRIAENIPAFSAGKRMELLRDTVDRSLPDHWCE